MQLLTLYNSGYTNPKLTTLEAVKHEYSNKPWCGIFSVDDDGNRQYIGHVGQLNVLA